MERKMLKWNKEKAYIEKAKSKIYQVMKKEVKFIKLIVFN